MNNKSTFLDYEVMKEEISPDNVFAMAEIIAFAETRYLISYMGTQMQKTYIDLYKDILNKNDVSRVFSSAQRFVFCFRKSKTVIFQLGGEYVDPPVRNISTSHLSVVFC